MNPPWLRIVRDPRWDIGPTIPYILGALRVYKGAPDIARPEVSRAELHDLLLALRDEVAPPACIVIQPCSQVLGDEFVVHWRADPPSGRFRIESPNQPGQALYHCFDAYDGASLKLLEDFLWDRYEGVIQPGRFSREADRHWHPFRPEDLVSIKALKDNAPSNGD